jgi:hypothetical protein
LAPEREKQKLSMACTIKLFMLDNITITTWVSYNPAR